MKLKDYQPLLIISLYHLPDKAGKISFFIRRNYLDYFFISQVSVLRFNPFKTSPTASKVKSSLTSLSLENKGGVSIPVNDVAEPIMLYVINTPSKEVENGQNGTKEEVNSMSVSTDGYQISYHTNSIRNESFRALFDVQQDGRRLLVRLKENKKPTDTVFDYEFRLPDNSSCQWKNKTLHGNSSIDIFTDWPQDVKCKQHPWSVFISDSAELDGIYIMGK